MHRSKLNTVMALVYEGWDDGDKWGSAIGALFDIATVMDAAGIEVPAELEYRRSPLDNRTIVEMATENRDYGETSYGEYVLASEYWAGNVTDNELRLAALTLNRYVAACVAAGLDY